MSEGPGLFSDFGKKAKDLLNKDYTSDQKFTVSSSTFTGLVLVSNIVNKGGLSFGEVATQYKHKNAIIDFKLDTGSNISTTFTITDSHPSAKMVASFKLPDSNSGKLEFQYLHEHAAMTTAVGLKKLPTVDFSATIGTPGIAFGAEASYMTSSGEFTKYNAGVNMTKPDSNASVILADKGDSLKVSYLHYLNQLNGGAVVGEIARKFSTNENTLTVGCSYLVDQHTLVKAKLNNHGHLGAIVQHELRPKSFVTVSGAFDTKALEKTPKFGLALSLKP
ncbi:Mitochondrial outer membrane protein porin 2 [Hibiscus syriacus]|uniref:Mitochondrial outer membrane protein porin 2 n=1 Tax=Hibiscus syriacus TaxID=106335 RepID=A0A6A3BLE0_HIBSY|nr:mitochondrial outer membrane protein porin 2-like [Hibiscus syriacus]KAE8715639.1 Mitochondrial outer membrane protein porin 2 [Hibiscus syriacus]